MIDKVFQFLWKKSSLASPQNLVFSGQEWFRIKLHLWLNNAYRCWDLWTTTWHFRIGSFPRVSKEVFTRLFNAAHVCFIIHFAFFLFELSTYPVIPPLPPPRDVKVPVSFYTKISTQNWMGTAHFSLNHGLNKS